MEMKMENGLACPASVVDHHSVALSIKASVFCNFSCGKEEVTDKLSVVFGHALNIGNVLFGDDKRVDGSLGVDVFKGGNRIILVDDFRRDFFFDDFAEDAVRIATHAYSPSGLPEKLLKKQLRAPV